MRKDPSPLDVKFVKIAQNELENANLAVRIRWIASLAQFLTESTERSNQDRSIVRECVERKLQMVRSHATVSDTAER